MKDTWKRHSKKLDRNRVTDCYGDILFCLFNMKIEIIPELQSFLSSF